MSKSFILAAIFSYSVLLRGVLVGLNMVQGANLASTNYIALWAMKAGLFPLAEHPFVWGRLVHRHPPHTTQTQCTTCWPQHLALSASLASDCRQIRLVSICKWSDWVWVSNNKNWDPSSRPPNNRTVNSSVAPDELAAEETGIHCDVGSCFAALTHFRHSGFDVVVVEIQFTQPERPDSHTYRH